MTFRKTALTLASIAALGAALALPAQAMPDVTVYYESPPPPLRVETVPSPRTGYIWTPGYWELRDGRHEWRPGHWERERVGYVYVPPTWVQRENRWYFEPGRWRNRDNDGDGVRNGDDRAPNNPYRN